MNCMRVPAVQTLLLYAKSLDTNENCTRILCDEWIEIKFLDDQTAQKLLSSVIYLRSSIDKLFAIRLENRLKVASRIEDRELDDYEASQTKTSSTNEDQVDLKERAKSLERLLKKKLSEFLDSSVLYSMRRILPAELATIYVKNFQKEDVSNDPPPATTSESETMMGSINSDLKKLLAKGRSVMNETKGGYKITNYLTYNW
jgi:hypothetical protein